MLGGESMNLHISNNETCQLAAELARLTSETTTAAITVALRERLEREKRSRDATILAQELHAIGQRCAALLAPGPAAVEHGHLLYDERGLPK
jgi:antitoxin VapB